MDSTLGVRILFAIIVGTLVSFNSLAADYNRPFRGAFKIESETVTASLRQLRETLSPYCDVNGCVVPEAADESSGFGGIIAPPSINRADAPPPPPPAATQTFAAPEFQNTLLYNID